MKKHLKRGGGKHEKESQLGRKHRQNAVHLNIGVKWRGVMKSVINSSNIDANQ